MYSEEWIKESDLKIIIKRWGGEIVENGEEQECIEVVKGEDGEMRKF